MTAETQTSTDVVAIQVRGGEEGAFAGWLTQLNKTIAAFPGYVGAVVIPPVPPVQSDWVMVQRFRTIEQLRAWLESDARRSLLDEAASLLADEGTTNVIEGSNTELSPQDMVTEIITVGVKPGMEEAYRAWADRVRQMEEARFPGYQGLQLQPPSQGCKTTGSRCYASIPQSISTPGSSPTLAAPLAWVLVPAANRALDSWLRPAPGSPRWTTSVGVAVILGLYALSVVVFTWLS